MKTTKEAAPLRLARSTSPALRLLYTPPAGVVSRPPHFLREGATQIGRELAGRGLLLSDDDQASRVHATVHLDSASGQLRIVDEGSRNGTFVNGLRISDSHLVEGDILRIGNSLLLVRSEPLSVSEGPDLPIAGLLGSAPAMRQLRKTIRLVAPTPAMVLLLGESGSGKEVVSRAIHELSGRSGPLVAINCSAIPDSLAESQLFGHVRGAFTGAAPHSGFFRAAHGGTLFLDEVGELPAAVQPKLLRALEEKAVVPVGATEPVACDVRFVAATNRDLTGAVEAGTFRGDLLARLAEFTLALPPLRDRREDILPLVQRALLAEGASDKTPPPRLHPELAAQLVLYRWPYNVRELLKVAMELRIRAQGATEVGVEMLADRLALLERPAPSPPAVAVATPVAPAPTLGAAPAPPKEKAASARGPIPTREELLSLMQRHNNVIADVAREVGRSRAQVYRWLQQHGLDRS